MNPAETEEFVIAAASSECRTEQGQILTKFVKRFAKK